MLASSSRRGTLPANLQGLWAEKMANAWEADYHLNINIQMNYWLAGMTGVPECAEPILKECCEFILSWGQLVQADIVSRLGNPLKLRYGAKTAEYKTEPGQRIAFQ